MLRQITRTRPPKLSSWSSGPSALLPWPTSAPLAAQTRNFTVTQRITQQQQSQNEDLNDPIPSKPRSQELEKLSSLAASGSQLLSPLRHSPRATHITDWRPTLDKTRRPVNGIYSPLRTEEYITWLKAQLGEDWPLAIPQVEQLILDRATDRRGGEPDPLGWNLERHYAIKLILSLPSRDLMYASDPRKFGGKPARHFFVPLSPIVDIRRVRDLDRQTIEARVDRLYAGDAWPALVRDWAREYLDTYGKVWPSAYIYSHLTNKKYPESGTAAAEVSRWLLQLQDTLGDDFNRALVERARTFEEDCKEGVAWWLQRMFPEGQDAAGEVKDVFGELKDAAGDVKDAAGDVKDVSGEVKDAFLEVKDVSGEVKDASIEVKDDSKEVKELLETSSRRHS